MNRQELLEEIKRLKKEKNLHDDYLNSDGFLKQDDYDYLKIAFDKNKVHEEKWHQIVRFALSENGEHKYMYKRLLHLLLRHRKSYNDYFLLKTETGTTPFPDRISDINRMLILYNQFFEIFKKIIANIQFDYPLIDYKGSGIKGKINWMETIRKEPYPFPFMFRTYKWKREFDVPENTLLLLPVIWLNHESKRLLHLQFVEPLSAEEKSVLNLIAIRTSDIIFRFPFSEIVSKISKYADLPFEDRRIVDLEQITETRLKHGITTRKEYYQLLHWIRKFRELNLRMVTRKRTNFPLESLENLDTIYEAWIFFEFVEFFSKIGILKKFEMGKDTNHFEIKVSERNVQFYHGLKFPCKGYHAWAATSKPDFVVMDDDEIIAVFDAKNYGKSSWLKGEAAHKILAYMTNLDCGFGGLFFPHFETTEFNLSDRNRTSIYHNNLKAGHYNMPPSDSQDAINIKQKTMKQIFLEVLRRMNNCQITNSLIQKIDNTYHSNY